MATTLSSEPIEAVILNGPRRGQIVSFSSDEADGLPSLEESQLLQMFVEQVGIMAENVSEMRARVDNITETIDRIGDVDGLGQ